MRSYSEIRRATRYEWEFLFRIGNLATLDPFLARSVIRVKREILWIINHPKLRWRTFRLGMKMKLGFKQMDSFN